MTEPGSPSDAADGDAVPGFETVEPRPPVFGTEEPAAPILLDDESVESRSTTPLGPGLLESLLWILGFFFMEIAGSTVWVTAVMLYHTVKTGQMPPPSELPSLLAPVMSWMIGTIKFAEVVVALLAIRLRFGRQAFRATGFRRIPAMHAVVLGLAVLPTAFLSGQSFALLQGFWGRLTQLAPGLKVFDGFSSIEAVQAMAESTPLAVLVLIIAVFPALNEEFVFRAAIGRGLLARYGLIAGIALTSMFFAAVHLHPVHALALLPLAVLMHVGYLSSGSIWAPVGVHFLNNALSVMLMKLATVETDIAGMATDVTEAQFSPLLFFASAACVGATIWLLMEVRIRWKRPDGDRWRPERLSVEPPPAGLDAAPTVPVPPTAAIVTAAVCYTLYPVAVVVGIWLQQR
ncbi:MAG: CPBP family intramembrane glutamic endopeptidase [Planctomycetaceae bacterium]